MNLLRQLQIKYANSTHIDRCKNFIQQEITSIGLSVIVIILAFDLPHRLVISLCLGLLVIRIKKIPLIENRLQVYLRDRLTIESHWSTDWDLRILNHLIRLLFCLFLFSFLYLVFLIPIEDLINGNYLEQNFYISYVSLTSLFLVMLFSLLGDLHIIFRRNRVVESKTLQCGIACAKFLAVFIPSVEIASHTPAVGPNPVVNFYQMHSPTGRGYVYESSSQMIHHDVLKATSVYDQSLLIDTSTNKYSSTQERTFITKNQVILAKELSTFECHAVGLSKGTWY
jgi:hypothetical protein